MVISPSNFLLHGYFLYSAFNKLLVKEQLQLIHNEEEVLYKMKIERLSVL